MEIKVSDAGFVRENTADNTSINKTEFEITNSSNICFKNDNLKFNYWKDPSFEDNNNKLVSFDEKLPFYSPDKTSFIKNTVDEIAEKTIILDDVDLRDNSTLALTSSLLSAMNVPEMEPLKLTVNMLTAGNKRNELKEDFKNGDLGGIASNLINFAKSGWGTAVSGAVVLETVATTGVELGMFSSVIGDMAGKTALKTKTLANKVALPFAYAGVAVTAYDFAEEKKNLKNKKEEFKNHLAVEANQKPKIKILERNHQSYQDKKLKTELENLKTKTTMKGVGLGFTTLSTVALTLSVTHPLTSKYSLPVSVAAGVVGSVSSAFSDEKLRELAKKKFHDVKERVISDIIPF